MNYGCQIMSGVTNNELEWENGGNFHVRSGRPRASITEGKSVPVLHWKIVKSVGIFGTVFVVYSLFLYGKAGDCMNFVCFGCLCGRFFLVFQFAAKLTVIVFRFQ